LINPRESITPAHQAIWAGVTVGMI
jgi:hypothetical protein